MQAKWPVSGGDLLDKIYKSEEHNTADCFEDSNTVTKIPAPRCDASAELYRQRWQHCAKTDFVFEYHQASGHLVNYTCRLTSRKKACKVSCLATCAGQTKKCLHLSVFALAIAFWCWWIIWSHHQECLPRISSLSHREQRNKYNVGQYKNYWSQTSPELTAGSCLLL